MITTSSITTWLPYSKSRPNASLRLFCFPYSGSGASIFCRWANELPPTIELCPVQLPGRENRMAEPPYTEVKPLAEALASGLWPYLDRPFAFFGHSLGALVSFELARQLRKQSGPSPIHLFVSGCGAPQVMHRDITISTLPEPELIEQLRQFNGTPEEVLDNAELRELVIPIIRADFAICETYTYQVEEPLGCPISAFGGLRDPEVSHEQLEAWREHTASSFSVRMFPGDHFFLVTDRSLVVGSLARELSRIAAGIPFKKGL
jgi:medium-chain acyl-[acyl-carrier-protein] hydrolase